MKSLMEKVENIVENGENAGYQHFLLFHSVFKSLPIQGCLTLYDTILTLNDPEKEVYCEHCGKRRKCW